ncbi:mannose-6-phosphate isomerase, class I [Bifidobacterium magnum]|uniref:mannose-6-phosphate isomerase n=1 Tax=Bifidobacterium magnum TaxID=1692 RepID=A0A087BBJ6_9BIFI|nr:mannose-6-phosphate isomerase, class I [Bifidobacterium magnum]KFI68396.1 Mannose-6-phosphate isomerase [Bifidobacterium magnum]
MYTIHPVAMHYAWGSYDRLQRMFHLPETASKQPLAEMWFSGHEQAPSLIDIPRGAQHDGYAQRVPQAIVNNPEQMVGVRGSNEFGPVLPFLFKVISAREPLSLQVHPVGFQARAGFHEENVLGIPLTDPRRSFKDMNEKSEMVVALEQFRASVGFASRSFALKNLSALANPVAQRMARALQPSLWHADSRDFAQADAMMPAKSVTWSPARKAVFRAFHTAVTSASEVSNSELVQDLLQAQSQFTAHPRNHMAFDFAIRAAQSFPDDMSVLALLMMNPLTLEEGESVYIEAGMPHVYIQGTGAEIMTNSDNVLRAGMTVKHKDLGHFLEALNCKPGMPLDPSDAHIGTLTKRSMVFYRPQVREYMLVYGHVDAAQGSWPVMDALTRHYDKLVQQVSGRNVVPHLGPRVVLCTQGAVLCVTERDRRVLRQGEAVFVPADDGWGSVEPVDDGSAAANGSYIVASTPF